MFAMKRLILGHFGCLVCVLLGCTTPIPVDQNQSLETSKQVDYQVSSIDRSALTRPDSLLTRLAQDASALDQWEQSDGWVMYYQGKLTEAIKAFGAPNPSSALGLARAHLELADSYDSLARSTEQVAHEWLKLERQSPHAALYERWIDWTELSLLTMSSSSAKQANALLERLSALPEMEAWVKVAQAPNPEHCPDQASRSYRLWLEFAQLVSIAKSGDRDALLKARKREARLMKRQGRALIQPIFSLQPDPQHPEHKVFDLRLAAVHRDYHALEALEALSQLSEPWGALLRARARDLLGDYQRAVELLSALLRAENSSQPPSDAFLLLTSNLSQDDVFNETRARLAGAHCSLGQLDRATTLLKRLWADGPTTINMTIWSLWAAARCPRASEDIVKMTDDQLKLFPRSRRPLSQVASDQVQGPAAGRLASLGIADRWLDELQYQYAWAMSALDKRVPALNALSSAEDSRAPMRLGGRNRLHRLALSATHQINLRRLRVASKYFLRFREQLPAVAALAEMTSDVLSGTSFSVTGQVNAGQ